MASDIIMNEKISIQNILFTKAMPNYKIPIPTDGYKVHSCTDCGDRFLFESSLAVHINRKSFMIKYLCRYCGCLNEFFNRCQFLSHIRSHVTKTATVNISDIKVEPLPLITSVAQSSQNNQENDTQITKHFKYPCFECKDDIAVTGILEKDRALHYMQTTRMLTCPVCLFTLPSSCALIAHLRIHLKTPPFICSECGAYLSLRTCMYPYNHDCDGFKMMRVTSRIKCINGTCPAIHPNNFLMHLKSCHLNKIYKCPNCYLAGYSENAVLKHVMRCCNKTKYPTYFECQQCPGNFLSSSQIHKHLDKHFQETQKNCDSQIFPCWSCGLTLSNVYDFLNHHISKHWSYTTNKILGNVIKTVKYGDCDSCHKTLWYWQQSHERLKKCFYCILNGNSETIFEETSSNQLNKHHNIKCHVCKIEVNENWEDIKKHFNQFHKSIKYLDLKLVVSKLNSKSFQKYANRSHNAPTKKITKHFKQKKRPSSIKPLYDKINIHNSTKEILKNSYNCLKCNYNTEDIISYETHIKTHRDPDMAYQCMECGNCLAVKPSFSKHLLLEHNISDVEYYVKNKDCFNKTAFEKTMKVQPEENLPLEKNQCNVCRDKFIDSNSLEKHYRVHGMAFLIKNTQKSKSPQNEKDNIVI
ncbi:zinc finger protein 592-like [Pieris brassicae]|uniref:zinc finger protein 592-like n=1 Tax=Pieris brassicae TaxID=7116 RepID=UPI001E66027E|nr:zinc finger protein 592-like [Pieris brassicae]XP_045527236.1 zinc finger protein 592-like [Pieris brassicae]